MTGACVSHEYPTCSGTVCPANGDGSKGRYKCKCNLGYHANGVNCADIDECTVGVSATETVDCGVGTCVNNDGSYSCDCPTGYELDANEITCIDIHECDRKTDQCGAYTCTNNEGSYTCDCNLPEGASCVDDATCDKCTCDTGYREIDGLCVDIDECSEDGSLCEHGTCINTAGDYVCECNYGFSVSTDFKTCTDIDECFTFYDHECPVHTDCLNTPGGYVCVQLTCMHRRQIPADFALCPDPHNCLIRVGDTVIIGENDCGLAHCVNNYNGFNCACLDPIDPKAWSTEKLVFSVDEGWADETVEGAKAKCALMGYEIHELRYSYQFEAMVEAFGNEKLNNVWAGKLS